MYVIMTSGNSIIECVMYADGDIIYSKRLEWFHGYHGFNSGLYKQRLLLLRTQAQSLHTPEPACLKPVGMQLMAGGSIYSYETDGHRDGRLLGIYNKPELDILRFGR